VGEKEARENLISVSRENLPDTLINIFAALLIWLFGVLVFLPAAKQITTRGVPLASTIIVLIAFSVFIIRAFNSGLIPLLDSTSDVMAYKYKNWKKPKISIEKLKKASKNIVYVATALILYLLYSSFLLTIHPSLNGLALIPIILWIFWTILKTVNTVLLEQETKK
jgi:hypothetical protein